MKLNVKKFADLTGVSVRTLHYYDEIGLLNPEFVDEYTGYRFYGEKSFEKMQEILFYRELDFPLKEIKKILSSPNYNKKEALRAQKKLLVLKKERLQRIIDAIESAEKGNTNMNFDAFDKSEFEAMRDTYKHEAKQRWGETEAYREHEEKTANYSSQKWNDIGDVLNLIIAEFAEAMKSDIKPENNSAILLAEKLKDFITQTQYTCTNEILSCLGEMYVEDERFKQNIDRFGEGTAEFIRKSIKAYCEKN